MLLNVCLGAYLNMELDCLGSGWDFWVACVLSNKCATALSASQHSLTQGRCLWLHSTCEGTERKMALRWDCTKAA